MENDIPEVNLELTTIYVAPEVRKTKTKLKVVYEVPEFGIHKSCRKQFGINNALDYWLWKRRMRKLWIKKNGTI